MQIKDKVVIVTGGANGIGRALCRRFASECAAGVVVADIDFAGAEAVAKEIGGTAMKTDVAREPDMRSLVERAIARHGRVDIFCSNAGVILSGGEETPDADWQRIWEINVLAHVDAARAALPGMLARRRGIFSTDDLSGGTAFDDRLRNVRGDQARFTRLRGMACNYIRRSWHSSFRALPTGRPDEHAYE